MGRIADYIIGLLEETLGEPATREKRFAWAVGDPSPRTGRSALLPFDAVWEPRRLIVEVDEDQHRRPVKFWDKPDIVTVSGVSRGRHVPSTTHGKRAAARAQGFPVVEIPWERRPPLGRRNREADRRRLTRLLGQAGVSL